MTPSPGFNQSTEAAAYSSTNSALFIYLLGADGQPRRVLQAGATTNLGTITKLVGAVGQDDFESAGLSLNRQGRIALVVQIDGGPDTLVLLTPSSP